MKTRDLKIIADCTNINWEAVQMLLKEAGMGTHSVEKHKTAFENSTKVVFIFDNKDLIAIGRLIIDELLINTENMNIILYATPGKEDFYKKLGFCRAKTCMIKFASYELMKEKDFVE